MVDGVVTLGSAQREIGNISLHDAEIEGQRVRVVRMRNTGARSPRGSGRRLEERAMLDLSGVLEYRRSLVKGDRPWLATDPIEGVGLDDWESAVRLDRRLASPEIACRLVFELADRVREVYKQTRSLPGEPIADVVVDYDGICHIGYLGEFSSTRRPGEGEQVERLLAWWHGLAGPNLPDNVAAAAAEWASCRRLSGLCDAIERLWLDDPSLVIDDDAVATIQDRIDSQAPEIAPPSLLPEESEDLSEDAQIDRLERSSSQWPTSSIRNADAPTPPTAPPGTRGRGRDLRSGAVVGGKYRLVRSLGAGAMGQVYEAIHLGTSHRSAVKLLRAQGADAKQVADFDRRFRREASAMSVLNHPNIVGVHDFGSDEACWLAMELIEGPSLAAMLGSDRSLEPDHAVDVARQLCAALSHAHSRGIVHRDIKPANVLVADEITWRVKLADFGLAKSFNDAEYTVEGTLIGTPQYMSPEQCSGDPATAQSDIYSLGIVLYRMLTGRTPFDEHKGASVLLAHTSKQPAPLSATGRSFPTVISHMVSKCLAKDPADRFEDAAALDTALQACLTRIRSGGTTPLPLSLVDDSGAEPPPEKRREAMVPLFAGLVACLLVLFALGFGLVGVLLTTNGETTDANPAQATGTAEVQAVAPAPVAAPAVAAEPEVEPEPAARPTPKPRARPRTTPKAAKPEPTVP